MATPAYKWAFWFSFPVDLHAGTGETARRRRSKRRFLADEVLIDSAGQTKDAPVESCGIVGT
jgi:hypothetical protein